MTYAKKSRKITRFGQLHRLIKTNTKCQKCTTKLQWYDAESSKNMQNFKMILRNTILEYRNNSNVAQYHKKLGFES